MLDFITESRWYKIMMPKLYGWGAAVVILGALFIIISGLLSFQAQKQQLNDY